MEKFCKIWEACSDMSFYIQQKLPNMTDIFGKDMSNFKLERFDDFPIAPQQLDNSFATAISSNTEALCLNHTILSTSTCNGKAIQLSLL